MSTFKCNCYWCGKELVRKKQVKDVKYHFCDRTCKGEYQRTFKPVTREWLVEHYIDKKMSCTEIAHIVKRDPKSVWNWLKDLDIPTRHRGSDEKQHFKKGHKLWLGKHHSEESRKKMSDTAKKEGRVPFDPEIGSYMKGRKGPEATNWKGGITPERQYLYSSREWSEAVKKVWYRDNATCQRCGLRQNENRKKRFAIHHIAGFQNKQLRTEVDNLILLCFPCHHWVHSGKNTKKEFINEC